MVPYPRSKSSHRKVNNMSLRILFLSHKFFPDVGGIEVNSEILANAFHNAGHAVHLITWSKGDAGKQFPFQVMRNPSVTQLFLQHRWADLVYENNICLRLAWPSVLLPKPSIVAIRTLVSRSDGRLEWQDKLKLRWLKRARSVIAVSDFIRRRTWASAVVIGNPYRADLFREYKGSRRNKNFAFLGRLVSDKGADLAIRAICQLASRNDLSTTSGHDAYTLTIIGDGPFRLQLQYLSEELGIANRIDFVGAMSGSALAACLNEHKYILVPSICEEAFGNVVLEGMACGCIPIVSDAGGLPDAVGSAGLVFKRGDVDALANSMMTLSENELLQATLRDAAKDHLAKHRPEVVTRRYLEVIEQQGHA